MVGKHSSTAEFIAVYFITGFIKITSEKVINSLKIISPFTAYSQNDIFSSPQDVRFFKNQLRSFWNKK